MPYSPDYPSTISEVLDPPVRFKTETIEAVKDFARAKPWRGTHEVRQAKFQSVHAALCRIYDKDTTLQFEQIDGSDSVLSCFFHVDDAIILRGKLSVTTYLHEFAHALGRNEGGAVRWSVSLFARCFPKSFSRCRQEGHLLRRSNPASNLHEIDNEHELSAHPGNMRSRNSLLIGEFPDGVSLS